MKRNLRGWAYAAAGAVIIVLTMAVYSTVFLKTGNNDDAVQTAAVQQDALKQFVTEQEQLRSMQLTQLDEIINSEKSSGEIVDSAMREKLKIIEKTETEQLTAGILRARGYTDAAVTAGDGYVTVMIRAEELSQSDVSRITSLIIERTDTCAENIKIIPIN